MNVSRLEVFVLGDGPEIDPDKGGVEPLACIRVHTDGGLTGLAEVFRVPPGVVQATVGGPVAMGYVMAPLAKPGTRVFADVRGTKIPVDISSLPFTPHRYRKG